MKYSKPFARSEKPAASVFKASVISAILLLYRLCSVLHSDLMVHDECGPSQISSAKSTLMLSCGDLPYC
jgi:hypothetical protein